MLNAENLLTTSGFGSSRRRASEVLPVDTPPETARVKLRAEVEHSLREVCGNWPTGEFDRVVADVTETAMKYHGTERPHSRKVVEADVQKAEPAPSGTLAAIVHALQKLLHLETLRLS